MRAGGEVEDEASRKVTKARSLTAAERRGRVSSQLEKTRIYYERENRGNDGQGAKGEVEREGEGYNSREAM